MTDEQRRLFRETQAVMSLLEGFSDYVMDEVGRDLVPDVERISARFHERRNARGRRSSGRSCGSPAWTSSSSSTATGERFVRAIADAGGPAALRRLWDGPESLPRHGEIDEPAALAARGSCRSSPA